MYHLNKLILKNWWICPHLTWRGQLSFLWIWILWQADDKAVLSLNWLILKRYKQMNRQTQPSGGSQLTSFGLKNVRWFTGVPNWPFRCLDSAKDNLVTFGDTIWNVQTWFSKAGPDESGDQNLIAGRSCCQYFLEQRPNSSLLSISFLCLSSVWSFWVVVWVQWAWTDVSFRNRYHCITPFGFETEVNLIDHLGTRQA